MLIFTCRLPLTKILKQTNLMHVFLAILLVIFTPCQPFSYHQPFWLPQNTCAFYIPFSSSVLDIPLNLQNLPSCKMSNNLIFHKSFTYLLHIFYIPYTSFTHIFTYLLVGNQIEKGQVILFTPKCQLLGEYLQLNSYHQY